MTNLYDKEPNSSTAKDWECIEHPKAKLYGVPFTRTGDPLFCYEGDHIPEEVRRRNDHDRRRS